MVSNIKLTNFKCFKSIELSLANLNLFSGINSMGKSTMIQALLLLRQSFERNSLNEGIYLNGKYVKIGSGQDLLYSDADNKIISIVIKNNEEKEYIWNLLYESRADFLKLDTNSNFTEKELKSLNLFDNHFEYIAAERLGPKLSYEKSYYEVHVQNQMGLHGEYAVHYLYDKRNEKIQNPNVKHPEEAEEHLQAQVEKWLSEISPGIRINFENYEHANSVGLMLKQDDYESVNYYSALNVGFGITYVLPVIIALLKAKSGDMVIIENPEAHLHPKGQRRMGELISRAASGGVQILVETHSDHVLNGIRLSVKNDYIAPEDIKLYYFSKSLEDGPKFCKIEEPKIRKDGRLSFWPEGFFDEWDKAIDEMF